MAVFDVGRINYSPDYYSQNRIRPSEDFTTGQNITEPSKESEVAIAPVPSETSQRVQHAGTTDSLQELSRSFGKDAELAMSGKDSKLPSLDIGKAVSDMQKDSVLQQYQYFVGGGQAAKDAFSEDGIFFQKFSAM